MGHETTYYKAQSPMLQLSLKFIHQKGHHCRWPRIQEDCNEQLLRQGCKGLDATTAELHRAPLWLAGLALLRTQQPSLST